MKRGQFSQEKIVAILHQAEKGRAELSRRSAKNMA